MFDLLKRAVQTVVPTKVITALKSPKEQVSNALAKGDCPCCESLGCLLEGPQGGMSVNVMCSKCGSRFNVSAFFNGIVIAEFTHGPQSEIWGATRQTKYPNSARVKWVEEALARA